MNRDGGPFRGNGRPPRGRHRSPSSPARPAGVPPPMVWRNRFPHLHNPSLPYHADPISYEDNPRIPQERNDETMDFSGTANQYGVEANNNRRTDVDTERIERAERTERMIRTLPAFAHTPSPINRQIDNGVVDYCDKCLVIQWEDHHYPETRRQPRSMRAIRCRPCQAREREPLQPPQEQESPTRVMGALNQMLDRYIEDNGLITLGQRSTGANMRSEHDNTDWTQNIGPFNHQFGGRSRPATNSSSLDGIPASPATVSRIMNWVNPPSASGMRAADNNANPNHNTATTSTGTVPVQDNTIQGRIPTKAVPVTKASTVKCDSEDDTPKDNRAASPRTSIFRAKPDKKTKKQKSKEEAEERAEERAEGLRRCEAYYFSGRCPLKR